MNDPGVPAFHNQRSSGQDILLPRKAKSRGDRTLFVEINSRDRNLLTYPNPSQFRWTFQRPMKDIKSIQIIGGTIPNRMFNMAAGWNQFTFLEGTVRWDVTLTPGVYTSATLAVGLADALNGLANVQNTYATSVNALTDCLTITATGSRMFSLLFASGNFVDTYEKNVLLVMNSPARCLGFMNADYSDRGTKTITAPFGIDIDSYLNRIYVYVNSDNSSDITAIERTSGRKDPFTIVYLDSGVPYTTFNKNTYEFQPIYFSSPAPVARLISMEFSLRDEFYRPLVMNGHDFTLLLEVVYLD